ncbi:MAG: hypothetical protein IKJ01_08365, partial [Lachnospiraceae bacterium]|nr:hypothetical protein [Lachnospiraceae bacterium]
MKKQQEKIFSRVRRILCTFLILFMTIYPLHIAMDENNVQCETYILDNGWNAIAHGKTFENITLSETIFEMFGKEDTLVLKRTILEDEPLISNPILKVNSYYSIVDVYLDNELIYTYGREFYEKKKLVGYGTNFVELPEKYTGKELRIEYSVTENNAFEMIEPFTIADGNFIMQKEMAMASSDLAMVLFLIVFGMICMMVCLFIGRHHSYFITTLAIGMFSYLIGAWILCNNNLIIFVGTNLSIKTTIEYTTLYVLPITFMLYFYNRIKMGVLPKFVVLYYKILFGVQIIFAVGSYTLHILGIVFLPTWVLLVRVIIGLTAVFLVMLMVCDYRLTGKVNTIISTPFVLGILMIILELINHHISERITGAKSHQYSNTLLIAALLIVF